MSKTDRSEAGHPDQIAPSVARQIDDNLKLLFAEAASEDLPAHLIQLLDALRKQDRDSRAG